MSQRFQNRMRTRHRNHLVKRKGGFLNVLKRSIAFSKKHRLAFVQPSESYQDAFLILVLQGKSKEEVRVAAESQRVQGSAACRLRVVSRVKAYRMVSRIAPSLHDRIKCE